MGIEVFEDPQALGLFVAERMIEVIERRSNAVLGLATGSSPLPVYAGLAHMVHERGIDVSAVQAFALDEYRGIPLEHPESYHSVIRRSVTEPVGLQAERVRVLPPDGAAEEVAREFERQIRESGGVDLQLLGIGRNGHLAFNEPGSAFDSRTREVALTEETRDDNARFFDTRREVPTHALTQGIGTILEAREIVVVATGAAKAPAVRAAIEGPLTEELPASVLRRHPRVVWCLDPDAAALLSEV